MTFYCVLPSPKEAGAPTSPRKRSTRCHGKTSTETPTRVPAATFCTSMRVRFHPRKRSGPSPCMGPTCSWSRTPPNATQSATAPPACGPTLMDRLTFTCSRARHRGMNRTGWPLLQEASYSKCASTFPTPPSSTARTGFPRSYPNSCIALSALRVIPRTMANGGFEGLRATLSLETKGPPPRRADIEPFWGSNRFSGAGPILPSKLLLDWCLLRVPA